MNGNVRELARNDLDALLRLAAGLLQGYAPNREER